MNKYRCYLVIIALLAATVGRQPITNAQEESLDSPRLAALAKDIRAGKQDALTTFWEEMKGNEQSVFLNLALENRRMRDTLTARGYRANTNSLSILSPIPTIGFTRVSWSRTPKSASSSMTRLLLNAHAYVAAQGAKKFVDRQIEALIGFRKSVGIVVGVMTKDGHSVYAYGKAGGKRNEALDGDSVFEIGSIGKVFTSTILADMAERKELSLADPVGSFLPSSVHMPKYRDLSITLLDLVTHTAGFPRRPTNMNPKDEDDPYAGYTVSQMYQFLSEYKLEMEPGSRYEYSNIGFGLLGHILALKAGANYEELVLNRICVPLGMNSTRIRLSPELQARLANGHNRWGEPASNWNIPEAIAGAGGLRSTVNDLLKFLAANLELTPSPLLPAMKNAHLPRRKTTSDQMSIGLGWQIDRRNGLDIVGHDGATGGYASYLGFIKSQQVGVAVLANFAIDDDAAEVGFRILEQLVTATPKRN